MSAGAALQIVSAASLILTEHTPVASYGPAALRQDSGLGTATVSESGPAPAGSDEGPYVQRAGS